MYKFKILFFVLIFSFNFGIAKQFKFKHLTIQDGLSQSTINYIFQDSQGYMWFGTQDGLNKYDGYSFTIYRKNPLDTNSISHNWIWYIFEDRNDFIWIGTWDGLTRMDPALETFTRFFPEKNNPNSIKGARPTSICQDSNGYIWIGTWGGGISKYDSKTERFTNYLSEPENKNSIPNNFVRALYIDKKDTMWVGTWDGLSKCIIGPNQKLNISNFKTENGLANNKITSIIKDTRGILWVGTWGGGVSHSVGKKFKKYQIEKRNKLNGIYNDVSVVFEDNSKNLWIGTIDGGLIVLNNNRNKITKIVHEPHSDQSLSTNRVYSIFEDNSGLIWIGSNGLNIYNRNLEKFTHIQYSQSEDNSLINNKVWAFHEDSDQNIWIGSEGGLNKYDPEKNKFSSFKNNSNKPYSLSSENVSSIVSDKSGNLWIGTRGGGINIYNRNTGKFSVINQSSGFKNTKGIDYSLSLCLDNELLWIATYDQGLIRYEINNSEFHQYLYDADNKFSISGNYLSTIFKDSHKNIWIGGWGAGLCRYERKEDKFIRYLHEASNPNSLVGNIVNCIYEYRTETADLLMIGTNDGLSYLDLNIKDNNSFKHILEKDGLPGNVIYGILSDKKNYLWLSTNNGLCRLNFQDKTFRNYTYSDGLQSNEFNAASCLKRKNGQLLFGGVNGFNIFYPDSIKDNQFLPPIVITSFKIFDRPFNFKKNGIDQSTINLTYKQNFFSFEFAALDFSQPSKNLYAYKMQGFDEDWIFAGTRRYVSYTNLDPGDYTFMVKGSNSDGIWAPESRNINIHISPPYWQTLWFRFIVIIGLVIILYMIYRYRVSKILEIERLRVRIASDLHDDIGSALTRISVHSEIIQNSKQSNIIKNSSRKIGTMSREIITTMSDIVWSIDARNDLIKNLIDRMKDFSTGLLFEKDIQLKFNFSGLELDKKIPIHVRQNLFLIFKEAINNIYKHSDASNVRVDMYNAQNQFIMGISDNGIGYDSALITKGNGIKNMKMRAGRIGAELEMSTQNGVEINLKMKKI